MSTIHGLLMYSGTPLVWTPLEPKSSSFIKRFLNSGVATPLLRPRSGGVACETVASTRQFCCLYATFRAETRSDKSLTLFCNENLQVLLLGVVKLFFIRGYFLLCMCKWGPD